MNTFERISIEISRFHLGDATFRARAVAEFSTSAPLTVEIAVDADNKATCWCSSGGPENPATTLSVISSVLEASRLIAAG